MVERRIVGNVVYQELHNHHRDVTPSDVYMFFARLTGLVQPSAPAPLSSWLTAPWLALGMSAGPRKVLVPVWLRLGKALALTLYTAAVVASAPRSERRPNLLLPVPLGWLALEGAGWLALRVLSIWLPIWLMACLYTSLAFHAMAISLCVTAFALASGWRPCTDRCHAALWVLTAAATTLLADACIEALARLALFMPTSALSHLYRSVLPQLATALLCRKFKVMHAQWSLGAAAELRRGDSLTNAYTMSLRRGARWMLAEGGVLSGDTVRLQLLSVVMAAHAARLYFIPLAPMSWPDSIRALLLDSPAALLVCVVYVTNDWDRCWGSGALADQNSWELLGGGSTHGGNDLEFTCECADDLDQPPPEYVKRVNGKSGRGGAMATAHEGGGGGAATGGRTRKLPPADPSPARARVTHDRRQLYHDVANLLPPNASAFDVRVFLMLYGDAGHGFRTHAHAEAVVEISECAAEARRRVDVDRDASTVVIKVGYFLDQFNVKAVRGRRVTEHWPPPGYSERGYTGRNLMLLRSRGWSLDLVEEALLRTVNLASHPFTKGYAKIPQPGEYNCFAYSLNVLAIWLGGACPVWALGSLRTVACVATTRGVGIETWGAAMLMMLLQLPQPFNYAFGQLFRALDKGLKAVARRAATEPRPTSSLQHVQRVVSCLDALLPALMACVESLMFMETCVWLASQVLLSNNFGLIASLALLAVTPVNAPWSMR